MATDHTIYIVDDDEAVRDSLRLLLDSNGHSVSVFPTGTDFLEHVPAAVQGCLIVDVRMPGLGGVEVQQELKRRGIDLPVIVITGHGDVPLAVRAMKAGAADFVEKPFSEQTILASIERALERDQRSREEQTAAAAVRERAALLTAREREVLAELVAGHPNKVVAHHLSISPRTVEIHRARIMEKMEARSLPQLVRMAFQVDLLLPRTE